MMMVRQNAQLTELIKVFKQKHSQSATNGAYKKVKELSLRLFASITNLKNKNGCNAQDYSFYDVYWTYAVFVHTMALKLQKLLLPSG